jgi:hypothetical protein
MKLHPLADRYGDVIICALPDHTWELRDPVGAIVDDRTFADLEEAHACAAALADQHDGRVWLLEPSCRGSKRLSHAPLPTRGTRVR